MKKATIPISPAHFIDFIVLVLILFISLVFIIVFDFQSSSSEYWMFYLCWLGYLIFIILPFCLSYRGMMMVTITDEYIQSSFFFKKCCKLSFDEIRYVRFVKSYNYGADIRAVYIVISNELIKGKHLAITFNPKKQIVIRVTSRNYPQVKQMLTPLQLLIPFPKNFDVLKKIALNADDALSCPHPSKNDGKTF